MDKSSASITLSSIKDNHKRGSVGAFFIESIKPQSDFPIVSAYFTIYVYYQLKKQLDDINHLRFLSQFYVENEPEFIYFKTLFSIFEDYLDEQQKSGLLQKAIDEIIRVFKKRSAQKLTTDRGALLIPKSKQLNDMNNFELVTWLVIK